MVKLLTATGGEDSTLVELEGRLIGLDGNGDWCHGNSGCHLGNGVWLDILVSLNLTNTGLALVLAGSLRCGVWVLRLEEKWVLLNVLEGAVHESTIATHVSVGAGAVNELLLREGLELTGAEEHSSLNGSGGGEGPA